MRFLALDLETTGTVPGQDRIVEFTIAELDHNGSEHTVRTERVNPEVPIPAAATAIHGITDADVATQPTFATFAPRIQGLLEGDVCLVAYRAMFDVRFLHHELVRAGQRGIPASVPVVDPYVLFLEDAPRTLADALRFYCGEDHVEAHGSAGDVRAMAKVLRAQRERRGRSLAQLVVVPDKRWLDWDRKVYADATGIARFAFGKHRDHPVRDHWDYVEWMLSGEFSADTKTVLRAIMASAGS